MAFTEASTLDVTVTETGHLHVRRSDWVLRDGTPVGPPVYHRHVLAPGTAIDDEDPRVRAIAAVIWTSAVIAEHRALMASLDDQSLERGDDGE
jgi:hypothetical protein